MREAVLNQEIAGEGPVDPNTGTRRLSLWIIGCEGSGTYGDDARGTAYESLYVSDDGAGCAEIAVYPVEAEWGWDVCEQATIGAAVTEDDCTRPDDQADIAYEYPHALVIESLEEAQRIAKRLGSQDYSYALNLRRRDN